MKSEPNMPHVTGIEGKEEQEWKHKPKVERVTPKYILIGKDGRKRAAFAGLEDVTAFLSVTDKENWDVYVWTDYV